MKSLNQSYSNQNEYNLKVRKTFKAMTKVIYIEENFNARPINPEHVQKLEEAYRRGENVPPIIVKVTDKGLKVIDGHHRFTAACNVGLEWMDIDDSKCLSTIEEIYLMVSCGDHLAFTTMDFADCYKRLRDLGATVIEIANKFQKSRMHVYNMIALASADDRIKNLVRDGHISTQQALEIIKEYGEVQEIMTEEDIEIAKEDAEKKIKSKSFSTKKAKNLIGILLGCKVNTDSEEVTITVPKDMKSELLDLLGAFQE